MDRKLTGQFKLGDPPQIFLKNAGLDFQLMLIRTLLVVTSATMPKIRTPRLDPKARRLQNRIKSRPRKPRLLLGERSFDFLIFENKRQEHSLTTPVLIRRQTSKPVPAINQLFNSEFQAMILS